MEIKNKIMRTTQNRKIGEVFIDGKMTVKAIELNDIPREVIRDKNKLRNVLEGCAQCTYKNDCARGDKDSELPLRHLDCFGKYRSDKKSIRFVNS